MFDNNKFEVNLPEIGKLSEPMNKLIDAVTGAIGSFLDPDKIQSRATARAVALRTKTKSEIQASELRQNARERSRLREERRQRNVESITAKALHALPDQVGEGKPDDDWINRFFENCQDVGDDDMQTIWGKILAGEVARPGSYSTFTITTLKGLGRKEAELFTEYCTYVWDCRSLRMPITRFLPEIHGQDRLTSIHYLKLVHLQTHGLIFSNGFTSGRSAEPTPFSYFGHKFRTVPDHQFESTETLTIAGIELSSIAGAKPDFAYMRKVLIRHRHFLENSPTEEDINNIGSS